MTYELIFKHMEPLVCTLQQAVVYYRGVRSEEELPVYILRSDHGLMSCIDCSLPVSDVNAIVCRACLNIKLKELKDADKR